MKCFCRKLLLCRVLYILAVVLPLASVGVTSGVGQFKIGSVLETEKRQLFDLMTKHYKTLSSVKGYASFTRQTAQLDVPPEKRTGIFKHVAAGSMSRVDLFGPPETLGISNGSYTFYRPKEKEAFTGSMANGSVNAARAYVVEIVFADPEMYQRDFRTIYLGKATINQGVPVYQLMLTPLKDPDPHPIELWVDMDGMPIQARVTERNGDSSTLLFTSVSKNKKIKSSEFAVRFKKTTKVVSEASPAAVPEKAPAAVVRAEPQVGAEPPATTPAGGSVLYHVLNRMAEHSKALTSLRAKVIVVQENAQLRMPDTTEGSVIYVRSVNRGKMRIRVDFLKPQEILAYVNERYILYRPDLNQAHTGSLDQINTKAGGLLLRVFSITRAELKAEFEIMYLGEATLVNGVKTFHLQLKPRTKDNVQMAELWVDSNGMAVQSKFTMHNNDSTTVLLSNLQKNTSISASEFDIELPKSTKIIKS